MIVKYVHGSPKLHYLPLHQRIKTYMGLSTCISLGILELDSKQKLRLQKVKGSSILHFSMIVSCSKYESGHLICKPQHCPHQKKNPFLNLLEQ